MSVGFYTLQGVVLFVPCHHHLFTTSYLMPRESKEIYGLLQIIRLTQQFGCKNGQTKCNCAALQGMASHLLIIFHFN